MRVCVCVAEELSISISVSNSQIQENVVSVFTDNISQLHTLYSHFCKLGHVHGQVKFKKVMKNWDEEIKTN